MQSSIKLFSLEVLTAHITSFVTWASMHKHNAMVLILKWNSQASTQLKGCLVDCYYCLIVTWAFQENIVCLIVYSPIQLMKVCRDVSQKWRIWCVPDIIFTVLFWRDRILRSLVWYVDTHTGIAYNKWGYMRAW